VRPLVASWWSEGRPSPQQMTLSSSWVALSGRRPHCRSSAPVSPPPCILPPVPHYRSKRCGYTVVHSGVCSMQNRPSSQIVGPVEGRCHSTCKWSIPRGIRGHSPASPSAWRVYRPDIGRSASRQITCGHHKELKWIIWRRWDLVLTWPIHRYQRLMANNLRVPQGNQVNYLKKKRYFANMADAPVSALHGEEQ